MNFKIRGIVGDITDPPEYFGQFAFVISIWDITGLKKIDEFPPIGPYPTEEKAHAELHTAAQKIMEALEKGLEGSAGKVIDVKTGKALRSWGEQ